MTIVTMTGDAIRAYNHAEHKGACVAITAALYTAAHILESGKALDSAGVLKDPPRFEIQAAIGDVPDLGMPERQRIARQRAGREAFVQAVFDGLLIMLQDIAKAFPNAVDIKDQRISLASFVGTA